MPPGQTAAARSITPENSYMTVNSDARYPLVIGVHEVAVVSAMLTTRPGTSLFGSAPAGVTAAGRP